jgi:hypothetical protein
LLKSIDFLISARAAFRHGALRVLKMGIDVAAIFTRRADALPLAGGWFHFHPLSRYFVT